MEEDDRTESGSFMPVIVKSNGPVSHDSGELEFHIRQVVTTYGIELGPGSHGRQVPYFKYGFGAVCEPEVSLVRPDGKKAVIVVPLPPSGTIKLSDLKKHANRLWAQAQIAQDAQDNRD